jgi:thiol:disulfide interchange protein
MVQQLKNKEEFHNALNANKDKLVVIDFYAHLSLFRTAAV